MVSIEEAKNALPKMIIGIILIILWLPAIFWTEINNKGNRKELKNLKDKVHLLNEDDEYTSESTNLVDGAKLPDKLDGIEIELFKTNPDKFKVYNYLVYKSTETQTVTTTNSDGKIQTTTRTTRNETKIVPGIKTTDQVTFNNNSKASTLLFSTNKETLIHLAQDIVLKVSTAPVESKTVDGKIVTQKAIELRGLIKSQLVTSTKDLLPLETELDMEIYDFELGDHLSVRGELKKRKSKSNTIWKWVGRAGVVLMLFGGLNLIIEPIRIVMEGGSDILDAIPLFNIVAPFIRAFGRYLLTLYSYLSFGASLILSIIFFTLVYFLVNEPIVSTVVIGLIVGITIYLKNKEAMVQSNVQSDLKTVETSDIIPKITEN